MISTVLEGSKIIDEPSVLLNLAWQANDDLMFNGLFSDGFRNGGFPARTPPGTGLAFADVQYDAEFVETIEFGAKGTFCDGDLRANLAIFKTQFTDQQINATKFDPSTGGNGSTIANLGDSEISDHELEANYLVNDNFRINVSLGYLDAKLESINTVNSQFSLATGTNMQRIITEADDIVLPHAPELQLNIGANYSFFTGNGAEIKNRIDVFYEDEQYGTIGNYDADLIPSTTRVNYVLT